MGDSASVSGPSTTFLGSDSSISVKKSRGRLIASGQKSFEHQSLRKLHSHLRWINPGKLGKRVAAGPVTSFLLEVAVLEIVRRLSKAKCPLVWSTLQALQVFCYPPFKWIQRWNPFQALVKGMQMLSRPLLVISIANAISDCSEGKRSLSDAEDPPQASESAALDSHLDESSLLSAPEISTGNKEPQISSSKTWLLQLYEELQREGITLPARIDDDELERFYATVNGNLSACISLVKKTISWRETYRILSLQELEVWSNMVFWHGFDAKGRLCLVVRLGLACMTVPLADRPQFAQAIVSQVEYGVLNLTDHEHSRITVLVDCEGLSPLKFPMKISLTCSNILQEHFPKRLGCVYVIRLPPVARVIAQTFIQVSFSFSNFLLHVFLLFDSDLSK
ncbi:OLC1v1007578C4 [Oldenlandia corymbosa var. corymbosa]|uniref:OLC1v1007578C4 n=1 Tax=Oldenlandia corymbosa var. corymbosa TaxID=529605 RepID=A0AAV1DMR7_OLDCO|nr:OLC1v1007578C4 [Oldenlandia corymbosa var. corymbosa]